MRVLHVQLRVHKAFILIVFSHWLRSQTGFPPHPVFTFPSKHEFCRASKVLNSIHSITKVEFKLRFGWTRSSGSLVVGSQWELCKKWVPSEFLHQNFSSAKKNKQSGLKNIL